MPSRASRPQLSQGSCPFPARPHHRERCNPPISEVLPSQVSHKWNYFGDWLSPLSIILWRVLYPEFKAGRSSLVWTDHTTELCPHEGPAGCRRKAAMVSVHKFLGNVSLHVSGIQSRSNCRATWRPWSCLQGLTEALPRS